MTGSVAGPPRGPPRACEIFIICLKRGQGEGERLTTINPVADAYVQASAPDTNVNDTTLRTDASPVIFSFIRFNLLTAPDTGLAITLRIYQNTNNGGTMQVKAVDDDTWGETTITHNNMPTVGSLLDSGPGLNPAPGWLEFDVSAHVTASGLVSFAYDSTSGTNTTFSSRTGANPPELVYTPVSVGGFVDLQGNADGVSAGDGILKSIVTLDAAADGSSSGDGIVKILASLHGGADGSSSGAGALAGVASMHGDANGQASAEALLQAYATWVPETVILGRDGRPASPNDPAWRILTGRRRGW